MPIADSIDETDDVFPLNGRRICQPFHATNSKLISRSELYRLACKVATFKVERKLGKVVGEGQSMACDRRLITRTKPRAIKKEGRQFIKMVSLSKH